jgi:hypothetical protein
MFNQRPRRIVACLTLLSVSSLFVTGCGEPPPPRVLPTPAQVAQWVNTGQLDRLTDGSVTFLQIADAHLSTWHGPGWGSEELLTNAMREMEVAYPKASLLVGSGDNRIYDTTCINIWARLSKEAPYPVRLVSGNVDPWPGWLFPDGVPAPDLRASKMEIGDNLFLFMDSSLTLRWHEGVMDKAQLLWLNRELSAVKDRTVFIVFHHPPVEGSTNPITTLANSDEFLRILRLHQPRQRAMILVNGHSHYEQYYHRDIFDEFVASSLMDGRYRVFHMWKDCLITYERWSVEWNTLRKEPTKLTSVIAGDAVVLRLTPKSSRPGAAWGESRRIEKDFAWPGFDGCPKGDVLNLDFADASGWQVPDRSGQGNDAWLDGVYYFAATRNEKDPSPWVHTGSSLWLMPHMKGTVLDIGYRYVPPRGGDTWELTTFDCRSLNSPAITNRLTLQARVMAPQQPASRDYVLVGKGSYELTLNNQGLPGLRLLVDMPGATMKEIVVTAREAISAGTWHDLVGTFDGSVARLYVDGVLSAQTACPRAALRASAGAAVVGQRTHLLPKMPERSLYVASVRISNQCESPAKNK